MAKDTTTANVNAAVRQDMVFISLYFVIALARRHAEIETDVSHRIVSGIGVLVDFKHVVTRCKYASQSL